MVVVVWRAGDLCGRRTGGVDGGCFRVLNAFPTAAS